MTNQANTILLQEIMGSETRSTLLYTEALKQIAANCNIPFDKTNTDYIALQEKLDMHYANCINDCEVKINATGALEMQPLTVKERLEQTLSQIKSLQANPLVNSNIDLRNALDSHYAVEDYLSNLSQDDLCEEDKLMEIAIATSYGIEFDSADPDFEEMRQQVLDCQLMEQWLKEELIDTKGLSFDSIKELYNGNDGNYDNCPRYHSPYSRMWG